MIILDQVTKNYNDNAAISNVSLTFDKRETTVIIGSSGSGKSTLLRCINNLEVPTHGSVIINGQKLSKNNRSKLCFKIGMVFQQFNLFPHMDVLTNLLYAPLHVMKKNYKQMQTKALDLLKSFGMEEKAYSMPNELSGGQKQRVAICRALMMDPEMILFDEPTSALDPEVVKDIINIIQALKSQMSMIIVTHHIKFAKVIADRVIFMDKGVVLSDEPAKQFFTKSISHRARLFLDNVGDLI
ncbi:MAG: amino acid ABC transporter ATP-binding protein [Rickettsiaceae bacterium]|nr:amino acid ABC transporter ATP-binding protein [Rickettsiaceae bacterium]